MSAMSELDIAIRELLDECQGAVEAWDEANCPYCCEYGCFCDETRFGEFCDRGDLQDIYGKMKRVKELMGLVNAIERERKCDSQK